jgi:hypothetical protein
MAGGDHPFAPRRQSPGRPYQGVIMDDVATGERLITVHHVGQLHLAVADAVPIRGGHGIDDRYGCRAVASGIQRHLMSGRAQATRQLADHRLGAAITGRGYRRLWRRQQTNLQRLQHHRFILGVNPHYRTGLAEQEALVVIAPREPTNRNALMVLPFDRYAAQQSYRAFACPMIASATSPSGGDKTSYGLTGRLQMPESGLPD